ncbi:hypothetical protein [Shewanella woodyi]|jgi:hypothetical protein|uniref:hypothetical protein n=1 Tax=Shewanella woodyi TaxID=60961 RepID=UPI003748A206
MKSLVCFGLILMLSACANSSGVVPLGDDSYLISRSEKGFDVTGSAVKADAIKEANKYCNSINETIEILKVTQKDMVPFKSDAQAEIEFKCVAKS